MQADPLWQAIVERDAKYDDKVVYAVTTTGIYCRPSCPSRKPKRENVEFFALPELASRAGYRPCKRCHPDQHKPEDPQVALVRQACRYIENHLDESLTLEHLGHVLAVSSFHLQRIFSTIVGISPRDYTETCRLQNVRQALGQGNDIAATVYGAGFGSSSQLYRKADAHLGMSPGIYQQGGQDMQVLYTIVDSPLGKLLVAATAKGICAVRLGDQERELEDDIMREFPNAGLIRDDMVMGGWTREILAYLDGDQPHLDLPLDIQATAFQRQVWQALQDIPYGETRTYQELAAAIERPTATRAVANAIGANPVAMVIPCHRVIRSDGALGGYRWGIQRKQALLKREHQTRPALSEDVNR